MDGNEGATQRRTNHVRDWIDPTRIYNSSLPAGRWPFLWGLAIYPIVTIFLLLTVVIIALKSLYSGADVGDYIGIATWIFMLAWVWSAVCICLRRLQFLGMSPRWVWLTVLPVVNLIFFLYLLARSG